MLRTQTHTDLQFALHKIGSVESMNAHPIGSTVLSRAALLLLLFASANATAAITLRAVATPSNAAPGERVRYAVTVSNSGSLQSVTLTGTVPVGTTVAAGELSLGAACDGVGFTTCAGGHTLRFGFNVAAGASVTVVYPALISTSAPPANGTALKSTATATVGTIKLQSSASATANSSAASLLHVTASGLPAQARAGGTVSYTLTFGNPGSAAVAANLSFPLPVGTTFVSASDGGTSSAGTVTWSLGTVAAGTAGRRTVVVQVATTAVAGSQLAADAALRNPTTQVVLAHAGLTTGVGNATETVLNVRAVATPDPAAPGQRVRYAVTVSNTAAALHSVLLTATVPANTTVAANELSLGAACDGAGFTTCAAGQTLRFGFNVAAGASVTVVYPALISTSAPPSNGTLLNSDVWVEDTSLGNEYQLNVAAIASSTALAAVPLTASAVPAPVSAGGTVSFAKPNAPRRQQNNVRPASSSGPKAAATQAQTNIQPPGAANVPASTDTRIVVVLDHALIDGRNWTPNADDRWVNYFAQRLLTERKISLRMVVAQGVRGISSLDEFDVPGALARLKSGVLTQSAMRQVVFLDGIGDFQLLQLRNPDVTASQMIAIHRHIIERVHALGLKIFGATIIPFEGSTLPGNTALGEANRLAVNEWIRNSGAYDAVVDFDLATSDPKHSARLSPAYDSGDHMHPNDVGYQAMAEAIDLSLFDE